LCLGLGGGQRSGCGRGFPRSARSSFLRFMCKPFSGLSFFGSATRGLLLGNPLGGLSRGFIGRPLSRFERCLSCGLLGCTLCGMKGGVPSGILGCGFRGFGGLRLREGLRGGGLPHSFFACRFLTGGILTRGFFAGCAFGILGGALTFGFSPRRFFCSFLCGFVCSFFCRAFGAFDLEPFGRLGRFEPLRFDRSLPLHTVLRLAAGTPPQDPGHCCQGQQQQDAPGQAHAG
jgi:hypothetical protein